MGYRLQTTGEYFPTDYALRGIIPSTPAPVTTEWMEANGVDAVFEGPQATGGTVYQYSQFAGIEQINGKWYTKYVLGPIFTDNENQTAAEQEAAYHARKDAEQSENVRRTRNQRLSETDWRFRSDMTPSQAWIDYCQALRDITTQEGFPWNVQWPEKP